jgi:hypothetical protein
MDEIIAERQAEYEQDPETASNRADLLVNLISAAAAEGNSQIGWSEAENGTRKRNLALSQSELRG